MRVPNTELPIDLENQVVLMKKYVNFRQRKKMRDFLGYAGYFRASRYGKFLLTQVNAFGSKADAKVFFELYDFDVQLRLLLFKYCKKAEVYFKSAIANAISLKTGDAGFYLDKQYYTPTKSEKDKKTRNRNVSFFNTKFFVGLTNDEEKLRRDVVKHPELKEYRRDGSRQNNVLPQKDADMLAKELDKLISKTKLDIYKMNILPANWKELYDKVLSL